MAVADTGWNIDPAGDVPLSFTAFDPGRPPGLVRFATLPCGSSCTADDLDGPDPVLWAAVQGLPRQQRAALVLRYYLDRTDVDDADNHLPDRARPDHDCG